MIVSGFSNRDLKQLFADIYAIRTAEKYTLMGYSLGGRIVLKILEIFPERVESVMLLAPDGLKLNPFYLFFSRTAIGRKILKHAVFHPELFYRLARFLHRIKIVGEKQYQFAVNNFDNKSRREKVYQIWLSLRNVVSDRKNVRYILQKYDIPMLLFFGKYDKIIPPSIGIRFMKGIERQVKLYVLEEGHRLVRPDVLEKVMILAKKDQEAD
jgi:pimeloyl-ACP methyl ester carboxylesterase